MVVTAGMDAMAATTTITAMAGTAATAVMAAVMAVAMGSKGGSNGQQRWQQQTVKFWDGTTTADLVSRQSSVVKTLDKN